MNVTLTLRNTFSKAVSRLVLSGDTLEVTYTNGRTYRYADIDDDTVASLLTEVADKGSLGAWVNHSVKPYFSYAEVTA